MNRVTVDVEVLFVRLLEQALPGVSVQASADVGDIDALPLVIVTTGNGGMVSNGGPGLGWEWQIDVSIICDGDSERSSRDNASALADRTYAAMHGFHDTGASMPGIGAVTYMEDVSMPSRTTTTVLNAGGLSQYDGTFSAIVRHSN